MMRRQKNAFAFILSALVASPVAAIEEAAYETIKTDGMIELRDYAPSIVAETVVDSDFEGAGNRAFRTLFNFIDGNNEDSSKIAMTAPVSQEKSGRKIAMTAPVSQEAVADGWVVSFMMPKSFSMETTPRPKDPAVNIRQLPAYRAAAIRYSGFWSEKGYRQHKVELESWIERIGLRIVGDPIWARYDPPFMPWFLRRNEVLIPVASDAGDNAAREGHSEANL